MGQSPGREMMDVFPPDISKGRADPARGQLCAQGSVLAPKSTIRYPGQHMLSLAGHCRQRGRLTGQLQQDQQQCSLPKSHSSGCKPPPAVAQGSKEMGMLLQAERTRSGISNLLALPSLLSQNGREASPQQCSNSSSLCPQSEESWE